MSVFREKNGICEGANSRFVSVAARRAPAGSVMTGRFAETTKTRLETHSADFLSMGVFFLRSENLVRFIAPYRLPAYAVALVERR